MVSICSQRGMYKQVKQSIQQWTNLKQTRSFQIFLKALDHIILNFLKVVFHNFHLVYSWMLYLRVSLKSTTNSSGIYPKNLQCLQKKQKMVLPPKLS